MTRAKSTSSKPIKAEEQFTRFIKAARALGCDESPDAFEAAVKKVARHKPKHDTQSAKKDDHGEIADDKQK
jgi:hypothetical protein